MKRSGNGPSVGWSFAFIERIGASIDILMCIRQIYPNTRDHEVRTVEVIV
jgi:hypothetical protein